MRGVDLASIVAGAYDAALQDDLWDSWAEDLFHQLGGSGGLFGLHDTEANSLTRIISMSAPGRAIDEYVAGYYQFDPQIALVSSLSRSDLYIGIPNADAAQKDVADYLRWQYDIGRMRYSQTAVLTLGNAPFRASICVHKTRELGPVTPDQHRTLRRLAPELQRALGLAFRHNEMLASHFWEGIVVGRADQIAFLVDERGRVMRQTDAATALITRRDGLDIVARYLAPLRSTEAASLKTLIGRAIEPLSPRSGAMRISRPSGRLPLVVVCYPLQQSARMIAPLEAAALVTVVDPHDHRRYATDICRQAFGLTVREAEMAGALMTGHSVESAAASLGVRMPTARTHLSRLFGKTGTTSQAGLIQLLMRFV